MIILWILAAIVLLMVFFAGWAGVFFACDKLNPGLFGKEKSAWRWVLFWGVYLGGMLACPVVFIGTVVSIFTALR